MQAQRAEIWEKLDEIIGELDALIYNEVENAEIYGRYDAEEIGTDIEKAKRFIKKAMTYLEAY